MKKKMLAVFICLVMVAGLIPTVAFAAENEVDVWDGTSDTSWYNETDTEFHIKTAEQLAGLAELTNIGIDTGASTGNTFDNKIIYLDCDLDLGDYPWTPITNRNGDDGYFFKGTFDGQGHTIYNLNRHGIGNDSFDSLFGYVQGGVIKNLNVVDADLSANDYSMHVGIIAALVENGKIINCYTSGTVESVNGWRSIGGIAGSCMQGTQIVGCGSDANIISRKSESSDSVGGLVGEWLNANKTSVISDCWFNGSIVSEDPESTVGGLLAVGYNNNVEENVKINNCMMVSSDLSSAEKEYTAVIAHLTGTPTVADCFYKESDNGYHVITKLDKGSLAIDTSFDPTPCAKAITDFTDNDILVLLQNNASQGVVWVEGIEHPTFSWDLTNRLADYTAVDAAIARATALDSSLYTNYSAVEDSINSVDRAKNKAQQTEVDAMAKAIEDAITALQYKDADYTKVDAAISKANALKKDDYKDFTGVEAAVNAVTRGKNLTEQTEVDAMAKAIEDAIAALEQKPSSGGGPSSGVFFPSYPVTIPGKTENGTVTVSTKNATSGSTVTITVKPDDGFKLDELTVIDKNGNELKLTDKGNGKYTFTMPASKVEINASFVKKVEISPFSDVSTSAYYYKTVKWAQKKGITGGIGNGLFGPNQPCTRAQIVTFLWRAAGSPVVNYAMNMSDVPEGSYYAEAVRWALSEGITTGTTENTFSPDSECTRAQAVAFLFRYAASEAVTLQELVSGFSDADSVPGYALPAMNWALAEEIVQGNGSKLMPNDSCTRAQIVTFLFRAYQGK